MKYHVEKSTTIEASVDSIRPLIADFNNWPKWSPWNIIEPDCPMEVEGTPGEVGQKMSWDGKVIGSGTNTLAEIDGNDFHYDLAFLKPWKSQAKTKLVLSEEGGNTKVTWTMDSSLPFFMFFMVDMMKNWIGMDYDRGLRMLKEVAEKGSVNATTTNKGVVDFEGFSYIGIERTVSFEKLKEMTEDFTKLMNLLEEKGTVARQWVTIYTKWDMKNKQATYVAAMSDENLKDAELGSAFKRGELATGKALEILHEGSYDFLGNAWSMGMMVTQAKKKEMKQSGVPFEYYHNSPKDTAPEQLKTSIYFPLKG